MMFNVRKASDWKFEEKVTINSLDDLRALSERFSDNALVIRFDEECYDEETDGFIPMPEITIYDDYLE